MIIKQMLRQVVAVVVACAMFSGCVYATPVAAIPSATPSFAPAFSDVPVSFWAATDIQTLYNLKVTQGIGNGLFGVGRQITRAEFVTFLAKLFNWQTREPLNGEAWYAVYVDAAVKAGAVTSDESQNFRPSDAITREEMAVMLVRSIGYDSLAQQMNTLPAPFSDVTNNIGYITIAKDFGVISGMTADTFAPKSTATREQAAAMMVRVYNLLERVQNAQPRGNWLNAYYAISSNSQADMISHTDSVSFGWARVEWVDGVSLNMSDSNDNDYYRPDGYEQVLSSARASGSLALLSVTVENKFVTAADGSSQPLAAYLISNDSYRQRMISQIAAAAADYDGVVIDFENLKGAAVREPFVTFLSGLKATLSPSGNYLAVAVQPAREPGQAYYDGYDFRGIGEVADRLILMAHDYYPKQLTDDEMQSGFNITPLSPIADVYYALKVITNPSAGVVDKSKVLLQLSFDSAQWKTQDGHIINQTPYNPTYSAIQKRIQAGAVQQYSSKYENPYITFTDSADNTENIVWYENEQSVEAKTRLASFFGIGGVSLWRLGIVPDDIGSVLGLE